MDESDPRPESLDRLWDPELETLGELLDQLQVDGAMDLEELDGFFAALHCCPEQVPPIEYLPEIFGAGNSLENEEIFSGPEPAKLVWSLIQKHWIAVRDALRTGDPFIPLLLEDDEEKVRGNNWALGFVHGLDMRKELWKAILHDEDKFTWLVPIFSLAHENDPDPDMSLYNQPIADDERELLLTKISVAVAEMYQHFAGRRELNAALSPQQAPCTGPTQKIGRNDPCYCGSGLKYKKCCGAIKVN